MSTSVRLSQLDRERFDIVVAQDPQFTSDTVAATLRFCRDHAVKLLVARCAADDLPAARAMEAAGGRLMDTLIYYQRALDRLPAEVAGTTRLLAPGDLDGVRQVAEAAFRGYFGHYHADPRLDRARCDEVYVSWAERSCSDRGVASRVIVAERDGAIAGFLTLLARDSEEHEIVLNAVAPAFQGQGVYRSLVLAAMAHAREDGARRISVSTQLINFAVQRTWVRLAFEPSRASYTFHLWFD